MSEKRFWVLTLSGLALLTVMVAFFANHYYIDQRVQLASDRLLLLSNLRRGALDRYLETTAAELSFWSANRKLIVAQTYFRNRWQEFEEEVDFVIEHLQSSPLVQKSSPSKGVIDCYQLMVDEWKLLGFQVVVD